MVEQWIPQSQAELEAAVADGRLDESHHLDFKRELADGKRANIELAKDLAMFANDGGVLIFGVDEGEAGKFESNPIPLNGLRERIEQVAAARCEPALRVETQLISTDEDPALGLVIVRVPASPTAPHMVDGKYYGRAGTTRTALSDAQVRGVLSSREEAIRPILQLLEADVERDPIPEDLRKNGHQYVVGRPRFAPKGLVLQHVEHSGGNWSTWFHKELLSARFEPRRGSSWAPDLIQGLDVSKRADGGALHDYYINGGRVTAELVDDPEKLAFHEAHLIDLEINEDGTLHLFSGRGAEVTERGSLVFPKVVAGLCLRVVQVAARVTELTGYVGTWDFAVGLTDLQGARAHRDDWYNQGPAYSADSYQEAASADTAEIANDPIPCVERLVGKLLRGIGWQGGVAALFPGLAEVGSQDDG